MAAFGMRGGWGSVGAKQSRGYPFPKVPASPKSPLREIFEFISEYGVDATRSDVIPRLGAERGDGNVYIESLGFATTRAPGEHANIYLFIFFVEPFLNSFH